MTSYYTNNKPNTFTPHIYQTLKSHYTVNILSFSMFTDKIIYMTDISVYYNKVWL